MTLQLGNQTLGDTFNITGTYNQTDGAGRTVPSPGILVSAIHVYAAANGSPSTARLYVWNGSNNSWLIRSGQFSLGTSIQWVPRTDLSANGGAGDLYIPAGTQVEFGLWVASASYNFQGSGSGSSFLGDGGDGNFHYRANVGSGFGEIGAYIDYTPLPAPTLTNVSPSAAPAGQSVTLTGTALLHTSGITVCGVAATSYSIISDTSITLTVPAGAAGSGSIVVTTPAGTASLPFVAGQVYGDNGSAWASGVVVYADNGSAWVQSGVQVWADDGSVWHQIG